MPTPNRYDVEARSYELDAYQHLNIAVFVNWLEHGRLCFLRDRGLSYASIPEEYGVRIMVVSQRIDYRAQVLLGDRLVVVTDVTRLGRSSVRFEQRIEFPDGRPAAEAEVTMVCVGADDRSAEIPDGLRSRLES